MTTDVNALLPRKQGSLLLKGIQPKYHDTYIRRSYGSCATPFKAISSKIPVNGKSPVTSSKLYVLPQIAFAASCAGAVFAYVYFNIDEIKMKQAETIQRVQSEQSDNINNAMSKQQEAIKAAQKAQEENIRRIKENRK